jgi:hypothetical protein
MISTNKAMHQHTVTDRRSCKGNLLVHCLFYEHSVFLQTVHGVYASSRNIPSLYRAAACACIYELIHHPPPLAKSNQCKYHPHPYEMCMESAQPIG